MKTQAEYVLLGGAQCPSCHSTVVESGPLEADGRYAWANIRCGECGYEYTDEFTLTGYTPNEGDLR